MAEKVKLPKKVAEAIREFDVGDDTWKVDLLSELWNMVPNQMAESLRAIYDWVQDNSYEELFLAIVNGYETEIEYVSFEEAMKALEKGKDVYFNGVNPDCIETNPIKCPTKGINMNQSRLAEYNPYSLFVGKWTIQGGENQ